ncbi:MAG TPA: hypothetical protein DHU63_10655, partial [Candidatus Marinimicrobia bacterium]|nr:MAG: hypothetical protein AUJ47_04910 [Candidatus Marinimicrobia bacterium CG1_02_48_14]PIZ61488.1 MAG: hypothetical protein COY19_12325 [Candidatus Marinimicrobia bacterium CG_4_10_14_0_2_um_filter_48_9]HCW76981.1 hypothetical protein [Candidatus Neomarinimicrobiota bacterium]
MKKTIIGGFILISSLVFFQCASRQPEIAQVDPELAKLRQEVATLKDQAGVEKRRAEELSGKLHTAFAQLESEKKIRIEGNRIIVANSILFNSGSAMIGDDGKTILDQIWGVLAKYPEREILIEGHTDNVPIADKFQGKYKSNWELSLSRSMAVLYYATSKPTAIPNRLGVVGYGEQRPIADNATEEGKRQNRRVEIVVGNVLKSK